MRARSGHETLLLYIHLTFTSNMHVQLGIHQDTSELSKSLNSVRACCQQNDEQLQMPVEGSSERVTRAAPHEQPAGREL
jgi:hypothetical protein